MWPCLEWGKVFKNGPNEIVEDSLYQVYVGDTILHTELKKTNEYWTGKITANSFLKKELTFPVKACASSSFFYVT